MGKTRDLFKKIRDQGNISRKDGFNKGQKWYESKSKMNLKESKKKTVQKKIFMTQIITMV